MHSLDFISQSPQVFIFHKTANKTNLGGILFLIYLIACFLIFLYYVLNYVNNNKYEIQYGLIQNNTLFEDMYDDNLNPETKVFISLYDDRIVHLSNNFIIVRFDDKNGKYISSKKIMSFTERICNIDVSIYYKCNLNETAFNCSLRNEDKRNYYYIFLMYKTF